MNYDYYDNFNFESADKESRVLRFLYDTQIGHRVLKLAVRPRVSKAAGRVMDSRLSKLFIKPAIRRNDLDLSECEEKKYKSYNDFFTRSLKYGARRIDCNPRHLISPCDSYLSVYKIDNNSIFKIKGSDYSLKDLLNSNLLADEFRGGLCLIFRLTPKDYHHYCYIDKGKIIFSYDIKGEFHTVRNLALSRYNIYKRNSRCCSILNMENFGKVVHVEVGALAIGKITNHHADGYRFIRGEEKGLFEYGGSTVVLLLKHSAAAVDDNIVTNSALGMETKVLMGQKIGNKLNL